MLASKFRLRNHARVNPIFPRVVLLAVYCTALAVGSSGQSSDKPEPSNVAHAPRPVKPAVPLPEALASALAEVKAKTHLAVLLPSELPRPLAKAKSATVDSASEDEYAIA